MKGLIVTGGAHGIGAEIACQALSAGYRVGLLDVDRAQTEAAAAEIGAVPLVASVTDTEQLTATCTEFGELDALVNCAGILRSGDLLSLSDDDFRAVIDVNLTGVYLASRAAAKQMSTRGGAIVNISSINATQPSPAAGAYVAAKAGVEALTRQMSLEWAADNIRVNAVSPGFVNAGMAEPFYADDTVRERRTAAVPLQRLGTADDIARAVLFLLSEDAAYISGQVLGVDGALGHSALHGLSRE